MIVSSISMEIFPVNSIRKVALSDNARVSNRSLAIVAVTEEKKRKVPCSRTDRNRRSADACNRQPASQNKKASRIPLPSRLR